jgi:N-acetylneuraminate synthase
VAKRLGESFAGTPKVIIHPGGITLQPAANPQALLDIFADTLGSLKAEGVQLLPENLPPRPWVFGGEWAGNIFLTGEEIKQFLEKTGFNMCFDVSHAALACVAADKDLMEMIKLLKPYIRHLHLADAAGIGDEGLQVGEGSVDLIPEIWQGHLHGGKGFLQAMEHLRPYLK